MNPQEQNNNKSAVQNKKTLWIVLAAVSLVALILCLIFAFKPRRGSDSSSSDPFDAFSSSSSQTSSSSVSSESESDDTVDFAAWQERNPDIYAWLRMPQAGIDEPVLRHEGQDEYYLRKNVDGKYAIAGSLFVEYSYNNANLSDPVTMIYGHNMDDGAMFGQLETWALQTELSEDTTFTIYQPDRELTYRVFAAVPYDDSHVLYYNDFSDEAVFDKFFENVMETRDLSARVDKSVKITSDDKVVVLSTCLTGDSNRRFLVMGVLTEDNHTKS